MPGVEQLVLRDNREIVVLTGLQSPQRAKRGYDLVHRFLLGVAGLRRDREAHPALHVRHVLDESPVRHAHERRGAPGEQARRGCVYADHDEGCAGDVDRLADGIPATEQLVLELAVDDRHWAVREILQPGERSTRIDVPAVHLDPLRRQPGYLHGFQTPIGVFHGGLAFLAPGHEPNGR